MLLTYERVVLQKILLSAEKDVDFAEPGGFSKCQTLLSFLFHSY